MPSFRRSLCIQMLTEGDEQKDVSAQAKDTVNTRQKDINREFTPVIEKAVRRLAISTH